MQEHAELTLAMLFAHGVAANVGILAVAVIVLVVKAEQNSTADWYRSVGSVARNARRQLI